MAEATYHRLLTQPGEFARQLRPLAAGSWVVLCFRLPAFEAKLRVRERKLPKWYWCDPGLGRAMRGSRRPEAPETRGALFEGLVAQLLRAYRDYRGLFEAMYYWAPAGRSQVEVDFLLDQGGAWVAVKVKSGRMFAESGCRGLRAVKTLPGLRRRIVVYPDGPVLQTEDGIEILPFKVFAALHASGDL